MILLKDSKSEVVRYDRILCHLPNRYEYFSAELLEVLLAFTVAVGLYSAMYHMWYKIAS